MERVSERERKELERKKQQEMKEVEAVKKGKKSDLRTYANRVRIISFSRYCYLHLINTDRKVNN